MVLRALKSTLQWGGLGEPVGGPVALSYKVALKTYPAWINHFLKHNSLKDWIGNLLCETIIYAFVLLKYV